MFIGHYGAGFAGKKFASKPSLGTMFLAAQFLDLLWPVLILTGIEKVKIVPGLMSASPLDFTSYPFSHSLLFTIVWGFLFGIIYYAFKKDKSGAVLLGLLVLSHWILDLLVHRPDLPLFPWGGPKVGLGLWNSVPLSIIAEGAVFIAGAYLYILSTRPKNKTGTFTLWGLVIFLIVIYGMNLFGSPPPSVQAIGYAGLSQWLIIAWGYWIDKNRTALPKGFNAV